MDQFADVFLGAAIGGCVTYIFSTLAFGKRIEAMDARLKTVETTLSNITIVTVKEA